MFSSAGLTPSFSSRTVQMVSNSTTASNFALKRKRDDIIAPRSAPANRGSADGQKIRELVNVYHIFQGQSGIAENSSSTRKARLLPSGDLILLSDDKISLILNALQSSKSKVVNIIGGNCLMADLERDLSVSALVSISASVGVDAKGLGIIGSSTEGV